MTEEPLRPTYRYEVSVDDPELGVDEVYEVTAYTVLDAARAYAVRASWGWAARRGRARPDVTWSCAPLWIRRPGEPWTRIDVQCAPAEWAYTVKASR